MAPCPLLKLRGRTCAWPACCNWSPLSVDANLSRFSHDGSLLSSMDARRRSRDLHLRSLRRRRARSSRQPLPTRCCFTMALLREKVSLLHHGQVYAGQKAGNAAHGRAVPLLGAVGKLLPRHQVGAALALHVLSGCCSASRPSVVRAAAAVLQNGQPPPRLR